MIFLIILNLIILIIMPEKGIDKKIKKVEKEKILYSTHKTVCFACGEDIKKEKDTDLVEICPYCKTTLT